MIKFRHKGSFNHVEKFFNHVRGAGYLNKVASYGELGVSALSASTPKRSGATASSWDFEIEGGKDNTKISWLNTHQNEGVNIAVLIQYGHGTGTGGYVPPTDFVNPAMKPVFEDIENAVWKEVTIK